MIPNRRTPLRTDQKISILVAVVFLLAATPLLYFFAPEQHRFYPRCLFHSLTRWQCPGCGGLRAAHHLLHGDLAGAWRLNPLVVGLIPFVAVWGLIFAVTQDGAYRILKLCGKPRLLWGLLGVVVLFGILRNFHG